MSRAKAQWLAGDWHALANMPARAIDSHPQRDHLALLVACAHQQREQHDLARDYTRKALAWGCEPRLVARLLVSGLHNTLGGIRALTGDDTIMGDHFVQALSMAGESDSGWATRTRALREMARVGLLPQAAKLIEEGGASLEPAALRPLELESRIDMLKTEVELLQVELALAHTRSQLTAPKPTAATATDDDSDATDFATRLKNRSLSQLGQDLWALARSNYKRGGYFVEFGATDGVLLSNSYLLERDFDWTGICAEPNPAMYAKLQKNRRCTVADACIGPRTGEEVAFVAADVYGGIEKWAFDDSHADKRDAYRRAGNTLTMTTISLNDLLVKLGAPRSIDYLSIDTEGSEFEILSTFPFSEWQVRLVTVEHNYSANREPIRKLMEGFGYRRTECQFDDFYEKIS